MRVQIVDPPAYTPPYDRSLCAALARAGVQVELITSRFAHGPVPAAEGYAVSEAFYRRAARRDGAARRATRAAEHVGDMLRWRRSAPTRADAVHLQWLTAPAIDAHLLPPVRPRVLTAHGLLRREAWRGRPGRALRALLDRVDAVVALSRFGAERLTGEAGLAPERVRVIPHGALDYLTRLPHEDPLPPELEGAEGPVVLFLGLLRPYKGIDVLVDAFASLGPGVELWVVGRPFGVAIEELRERARAAPGRVRFVPRFVPDAELPAILRRADVVALPHRDAEQSGVLYTALAFGKPVVMSAVGGFPEVAERGAGRLVAPGDAPALAAALGELLADDAERRRLEEAARAAAAGPYSWDEVARQTIDLYEELGAR